MNGSRCHPLTGLTVERFGQRPDVVAKPLWMSTFLFEELKNEVGGGTFVAAHRRGGDEAPEQADGLLCLWAVSHVFWLSTLQSYDKFGI